MPIELVIFGCEGVLVDSRALRAEVLQAQLQQMGVPPDRIRAVRSGLAQGLPMSVTAIEAMVGAPLPPDFAEMLEGGMQQCLARDLTVTDRLPHVLTELRVPACVVASLPEAQAQEMLQIAGLADFFPGRVFPVRDGLRAPPAPDLFLQAAQSLGFAPPQCLVFEASGVGLAAAMAAGMQVALYVGGRHWQGADLSAWEDVDIFHHWGDFPAELLAGSGIQGVH